MEGLKKWDGTTQHSHGYHQQVHLIFQSFINMDLAHKDVFSLTSFEWGHRLRSRIKRRKWALGDIRLLKLILVQFFKFPFLTFHTQYIYIYTFDNWLIKHYTVVVPRHFFPFWGSFMNILILFIHNMFYIIITDNIIIICSFSSLTYWCHWGLIVVQIYIN